ncbi:MAG: energy-coupling factor transporter ATPase [Lachnospiraceae bacterium]
MKNIIEIRDFSFSYPESGKKTLKHINMAIQEGSLNVLCGKSGCGKSTLLRQLKSVLALHGESSGEILYNGIPLGEVDMRTQSQEIGYVLQNPENQIVTDKVWHELAFGLESLGYDTPTIRLRVAEMASYFGIHRWFYRNVSELSGGQKQLLNLASVMAMHPKVLILDEPTSQLDPIAASDFLETVKKINRDIGTTVILTEHRLQDVIPWADTVFVMDEGELIASGAPWEIGEILKEKQHGMFLSMPVPMQIYAEVDNALPCPLTVREGRNWVTQLMEAAGYAADNTYINNTNKNEKKTHDDSCEKEIEVRDVWFRYEKDGADVVQDLSLTVYNGEFFALVGGNGTGKSTTLSLISRVRAPYRGKILLHGKDIRRYSETELYRGYLGVLPQNPQSMFIKKTVREDLYAMIGGNREKKSREYDATMPKAEAIEGIVSLTKLEGLLDRHPYDLSGGEQQRLALAKVLLLRPRVLLLDEPTKGLDAEYKVQLGGILKKLQSHGITIFMISHDVEFVAEYADRVGLFFEGNVVTCKQAHAFFAGNNFYTTAANRMARHYFPEAVTAKEVAACLKEKL